MDILDIEQRRKQLMREQHILNRLEILNLKKNHLGLNIELVQFTGSGDVTQFSNIDKEVAKKLKIYAIDLIDEEIDSLVINLEKIRGEK